MAYLSVHTVDGDTFRFELDSPTVRIGRSHRNDLVLKDPSVSRDHASIESGPEGTILNDLGGKSGVIVNGRAIERPHWLRPGDELRLGNTRLRYDRPQGSAVELSDEPWAGSGATILTPEELPTDSYGPVRDDSSGDLDAHVRLILRADEELVVRRPLNEIFESILDLAREAVPYERGALMLREGGALVPQIVRVTDGGPDQPICLSKTIAERVVKKRESVLARDALADSRFREGHSIQAGSIRSMMCVPLRIDKEVIGLLYVDHRREPGLFTERNLRFLTHLANVAAVKIEDKRLFDRVVAARALEDELRKAAQLQTHLLPVAAPELPGYGLVGRSDPCLQVGGDYFDFLPLPDGRLGLGLGDVAGKGLSAALLMCSLKACMDSVIELDLPPGQTVDRLNRILTRQLPSNRFVTFFYGVIDPATHVLSYVNAGQNSPVIVRGGGELVPLVRGGLPLGIEPGAIYPSHEVTLEPGDLFLCYSDGVLDGVNAEGELFGEKRLFDLTRRLRRQPPAEVLEGIFLAVDEHQAQDVRADDTTLMLLRRER
jgi:GAF domain-containing protein